MQIYKYNPNNLQIFLLGNVPEKWINIVLNHLITGLIEAEDMIKGGNKTLLVIDQIFLFFHFI